MNINPELIPEIIKELANKLELAGFEAYLVGGCVRDLILKKEPKDWDLTTDATPEEIQKIFPDSFYENNFGTVGVKTESEDPKLKVVEITPYRLESHYSDKRHPDRVSFSKNIEEDLGRRDFTINAMAYNISKGQIKDIFKGQSDLETEIIRTVGNSDKRFSEDALRMIRAIRFVAETGFSIENNTLEAIGRNAKLLESVSRERVRDEFIKIVMSDNPMVGLFMAQKIGTLDYLSPSFDQMVGVDQNKQAHKYDVWEHSLRALQHAADNKMSLEVRLSALFHDIGKPKTKRMENNKTTFYGHDVVGAKITKKALEELHFERKTIDKVVAFVRYHMFFSDTEEVSLSSVRRLVRNIGKENIWDLINLRICDRIGTGRPKAEPYRLRKFESMIEEVMRDPISVSMLKIDGNTLMEVFHAKPGPKIGWILNALLEEVIEDPKLNTEVFLMKRAEELIKMDEKELQKLGEAGKEAKDKAEGKEIEEIRKKFFVK